MSVVNELIRSEQDGTLSFGNYLLDTKSKLSDFEHGGDMYKVKTYNEITKLEKNGSFVYESVPGTAVNNFQASADGVKFEEKKMHRLRSNLRRVHHMLFQLMAGMPEQ